MVVTWRSPRGGRIVALLHADLIRLLSSRTFINTFIQFKKPIVAAVNGPALGLGAAILPLCDIVWANEKAWFQTPYMAYGQTPDACSSLTFPRIMGVASVGPSPPGSRRPAPPCSKCSFCSRPTSCC